jgi:hypothetical protein
MKAKCLTIAVLAVFAFGGSPARVANHPDPPQERPGSGKAAVILPALIWNPLNFPSGDSLHQSLLAAGYQSTLTDSLALYIDSLPGYHLFIMAGIYEHGEWPTLGEAELGPFESAILAFLDGGGRLYWEGGIAFSEISSDTLFDFFYASPTMLHSYPFHFICGREESPFQYIDSLGYEEGATEPILSFSNVEYEVILAPESGYNRGTTKAAIYETSNTRTMLANFSWARLHDGYANTRVDLIHNVMDWLSGTVGVEDEPGPAVPVQFSLSQNYPNPFNAATTIEYALPHAAAVKLEIFDILGQRVATVIDGPKPAGYHRAMWNAGDNSSGIYLARLQAGDDVRRQRMVLLK